MKKAPLLRIAVAGVVLLVATFVALRLRSLGGELGSIPSIERPWLLALGFAALIAPTLIYGLVWREIVCRLDKKRTPAVDAVAVFCVSWLGRYVPGSLPYLAGKVVMGQRLGHSKQALAASLLYENVLAVSVGAALAAATIPIALAGSANPLMFVGAGLAGLAGLSLLSPPTMHRMANIATRLAHREPIARDGFLSQRDILITASMVAVVVFLQGAGFACILGAFTSLSVSELVAAGAIFNLAGVAGIAAVPVPSGLGVREAVLIALLQLFVPIEIAAAAAVVARLIAVVIDISLGLAGAAIFALRQSQRPPEHGRAAPAPQQLDAA